MGTEKMFDSDEDIPDLSGKVIFITEGTTNPGLQSALSLAAHNPSHIYLTGPDTTKGVLAAQEIERLFPPVTATFIACDLSSLATVALAAHQFTSASPRLDIFICNAAAPPVATSKLPGTTRDGYEVCFGMNHIGHALLVKLLLPTLLRTVEAPFSSSTVRIVLNTAASSSSSSSSSSTSFGFCGTAAGDRSTSSRCGFLPAVGAGIRGVQNRLASLLYAQELARRYPSITAVAVNAGGGVDAGERKASGWLCLDKALACVTSGCSGSVTPEEGLRTQLWAATREDGEVVSGGFYERVGVVGSMGMFEGLSGKLARQLWDWTEKELAAFEA